MFRRVQDEVEPMMTLSLEVLDEVRLDLENRQGHDIERFSTRFSALTDRHLMALGILRRVDDGSIDSAAVVNAVTPRPEHAPMTEAEFRRQIIGLVELGILEESHGKYVPTGDQFDEVYLRYLAASRSLRISAWPAPPATLLATELAAAVNPVSHLSPYLWSNDPAEWFRADLETQLSSQDKSEDKELASTQWSNLVIPLRKAQRAGHPRIRWATFLIKVKAVSFTSHFYVDEDTSVESFETLPSFVSFRERVEAEGGSVFLTMDQLSIEGIMPVDDLIGDDDESRETIAEIYSEHGYELFLDKDYQHSFEAFCNSYEFSGTAAVAVSAAFQALHLEDWHAVIEWANKADAVDEEPASKEQICLAAYDRAIAYLMLGDIDKCFADLERVRQHWNDDLAELDSYLLGPVPEKVGELKLVGIADPLIDVVEIIANALSEAKSRRSQDSGEVPGHDRPQLPPGDAPEVHALELGQ